MVFLRIGLVGLLLVGCSSSQSDLIQHEIKEHYLYSNNKIKDSYSKLYHMTKNEYLQKERKNIKDATMCFSLSKGIHYCRIFYFDNTVQKKIKNYIVKNRSDIKALLIDLRHNKGGIFNEAIALSDLFLDQRIIVRTYQKDGTVTAYQTKTQGDDVTDIPLFLLIDTHTASAAEIFAGSLQAQKRAIVAGEKSFGKNSIQELVPLSSHSMLKLTVEEYAVVGYKRPFNGVIPDIQVHDNQIKISDKKWKHIPCHLNVNGDRVLKIGFCLANIVKLK